MGSAKGMRGAGGGDPQAWLAAFQGRNLQELARLSARASPAFKAQPVKRDRESPVCLAAAVRWGEGLAALLADGWSIREMSQSEIGQTWTAGEWAVAGPEDSRGLGRSDGDLTALGMLMAIDAAGGDLELVDAEGASLLHVAAAWGDPRTLSWLCGRLAPWGNVANAHGKTPLDCAVDNGNAELAGVLATSFGAGEGGEAPRRARFLGQDGCAAAIEGALAAKERAELAAAVAGSPKAAAPRKGL